MARITYIIQQTDVRKGKYGMLGDGKNTTFIEIDKCSCCGRSAEKIPVDFAFMGGIQEGDVGKMMVREESGLWYVENEQQFKKRTGK